MVEFLKSSGTKVVDWPDLELRIGKRDASVGIIGLGYVGLPLALLFAESGFRSLGFDIDGAKVTALGGGCSYIGHVDGARVRAAVDAGRFAPTADFDRLSEPDAILICVPTPLGPDREPDLSFVADTSREVAARLRRGQLVVLVSTSYPGTTREVVQPILEAGGLLAGREFLLAYSPEREDPGNAEFSTARIPKVVGADDAISLELARALFAEIVPTVVPVSSTATAEAVKLTENVFRAVNIALVNELKLVYECMGIDIWEVVEAAKSKPFGYMPFYPGPGLGGHCIPIDPFYLAWRARQFDMPTRFVELAGEINVAMPGLVVERLAAALRERAGRDLAGARVLVLGIAYKKNVDDTRESPAFAIWKLLRSAAAEVAYHDPHVDAVPRTREHAELEGIRSVPLSTELIEAQDAVLICTDHDAIDYGQVAKHARLVIDTRNATKSVRSGRNNVVLA
jgi:UDP-N-acetyl-D-glucosamine dehydrogenase